MSDMNPAILYTILIWWVDAYTNSFSVLEGAIAAVFETLHVDSVFLHALGEGAVLADEKALGVFIYYEFRGDLQTILVDRSLANRLVVVSTYRSFPEEVFNRVRLPLQTVIDQPNRICYFRKGAINLHTPHLHVPHRLVHYHLCPRLLLKVLYLSAPSPDHHGYQSLRNEYYRF